MVWKEPKRSHSFNPTARGQERLPLGQVAQSSIQPSHFQGMGKSADLGTAQEGIKCHGTCRFKLPSRFSSCLVKAVKGKQLNSGHFYCKEEVFNDKLKCFK